MKNRILFLIRTYLVTVLLFVAAKVVFMACNSRATQTLSDGQGHAIGIGDYAGVIAHGLSLDLSTALYFLLLPFLACMVMVWLGNSKSPVPPFLAIVLKAYFALASAALSLAFVADTSLYAFWGAKLDASCLQYLEQPEGITSSVSAGYLFVRGLLLVAVGYIIYKLYSARLASCLGPRLLTPSHRQVTETMAYMLSIPLLVIGIRGGLSESTTNVGQVYYSQNQFLNHAAVNPVFNFLYSLSHQLGDAADYEFMRADECRRLTSDVYTTESVLTDTLLRVQRPDIVIILLESCGEEFAQAMPRLQQLKCQGLYFSHCHGNSWRTDRGTVCALSGYPSFPLLSVMKMPEKSRTMPSIARTLQREGYATHYVYGGDINFTNMRSYLISTGWERLTSVDDFTVGEQRSAKWGVRDDITFDLVRTEIEENAGKGRLLTGFSTLSSHEPWDVPGPQRSDDAVLNAFGYLDECIYNFVEALRSSAAWYNLLIVLTADHGINYGSIDRSRPRELSHIPMLWLGGALREPRTVETLCNQSDLAATLLGQMGLEHHDFAFSRDVLSQTYRHPTATMNYNNAQWLADSTGQVLYDFNAGRTTMAEGGDTARLLRQSKAMLQRTYKDLVERGVK